MTSIQTIRAAPRQRQTTDAAVIHVHYGWRHFDISMIGLDLTPSSNDERVKYEIAQFLDVADDCLSDYLIDRHANGNLTIRPQDGFE